MAASFFENNQNDLTEQKNKYKMKKPKRRNKK
jgi:hypothetical protein